MNTHTNTQPETHERARSNHVTDVFSMPSLRPPGPLPSHYRPPPPPPLPPLPSPSKWINSSSRLNRQQHQ